MARTQIRGNNQIMAGTVTFDRLKNDFLAGTTWNVSTSNDATITGLQDPTNNNDAVNKQYVDTLISSTAKGPDSWDPSTNAYPTQYKGENILEGDPFVATTDGIVDSVQYRAGDMIFAKADGGGTTAADWVSVQANVDLSSESAPGLIEIATQTEVNAGTDNTRAVTPLKLETYINNNNLDVAAGNGLTQNGKNFDVVSGNVGIAVNADDITLTVGNTNGASLEISAAGVELASTVTGSRTFAPGSGETFTLDTDANGALLTTAPDGTVDLAIASVGYVKGLDASNLKKDGSVQIDAAFTPTNDQDIVSKKYVDDEIASATPNIKGGDGLTKSVDGTTGEITLDVVSGNAAIVANADDITLTTGTTNGGASLEVTATGVELASSIAGARTFTGNVTVDNAFETTGATSLGGSTTANNARLGIQPDGNVDLAIATTKYVDDEIAAIPMNHSFVYNETPTVTDGSTDVTLTNTPTTDTQRVYLNGVRQVPGSGNDYTISGNTITFADALASDDVVVVDYLYD